MQSCYEEISKNIQMDCDNPMVAGDTGRALLFPQGTFVKIEGITGAPKGSVDVSPIEGKTFYAIDNVFVDPFSGSATQSNGESGRIQYQKTLNVRIPMRGVVVSREVVEAMHNSAGGYTLVVEKKNKNVDGAFEIIGLNVPAKPTADGTARNEGENGGDITMTLQTTEPHFENVFVHADSNVVSYETTKKRFDAMYAGAGEPWQEPE